MNIPPRHLHNTQVPRAKCPLSLRSEHENPSTTSAQHTASSGQMPSPTEVCPLSPQRASVHVTHSPLPFTPFLSLHSISTAGHGCGHAPWGLTLLSSPHSWLPTPASLGAAPATAHGPITPAWQHPIAATSPHDTSGDSCWPWPHCPRAWQHPCPSLVRREVSIAPPVSGLWVPSGPPQWECFQGPHGECFVSCTPLQSKPCGGQRGGCPSYCSSSGWQGRLGPRPSSSSGTTSCPDGLHPAPRELWAVATWHLWGRQPACLPAHGPSGGRLSP